MDLDAGDHRVICLFMIHGALNQVLQILQEADGSVGAQSEVSVEEYAESGDLEERRKARGPAFANLAAGDERLVSARGCTQV